MTTALLIDTCGPVLGVGVLRDGVLVERVERLPRGGETVLMPWSVSLLAGDKVDVVGVAVGPGAFTGLRVGLASALGFAVAAGVNVVGVCSLQSRLEQARLSQPEDQRSTPMLAMLDARKSRVYARWAGQDAADIAPDLVLENAAPGFVAVGEGAVVYADLVRAAGGVVHAEADSPAMGGLGALTMQAYQAQEALPPAQVLPVYLRAPDAKPRAKKPTQA